MLSLKKTLENGFLYSLSNVLLRATSIIFFPIFSSYLTKSDYGILSLSQTILTFTLIFSGLELGRAVTRFTFQKNESKLSEDSLISNTLFISFISNLILLPPFLIWGDSLLSSVLSDIRFYPFIFWTLVSIPFTTVIDVYRVYLKAKHEGRKAFILEMGYFGCNIFLNLLLVAVFDLHVLGIIISTVLSNVIFILILWYTFYRHISYDLNINSVKVLLEYSIPLIPFAILNSSLNMTDKLFLNSKLGSASSGLYYIAITFASIFSVIKEAISNALTPWMFEAFSKKPSVVIRDVIVAVFLSTGFLAIIVSWYCREALMLLSSNPSFVDAFKHIPILISGLYIIFLGQLFNIKTLYYGKYSRYLFISSFVGIVANLLCCYLFIDYLNMEVRGAALARFVSFLMLVVTACYLSRLEKEKNEIYDLKLLVLIGGSICVIIVLPSIIPLNFWLMLSLKIPLTFMLAGVNLWYLNKKFDALKMLKSWI